MANTRNLPSSHYTPQSIEYFFGNLGNTIDIYSQKCDKFLLCGDILNQAYQNFTEI